MIVFVGLDTPLGVLSVEAELRQLLENTLVDRNSVIADNYAAVQRNI